MRKTVSVIALMGGLVLAAIGQNAGDERSENEIRDLNKLEVQALMKNDVKAMESLWSDDFVVTNPLNQFVGKKQVLEQGVGKSGKAFTPGDTIELEL